MVLMNPVELTKDLIRLRSVSREGNGEVSDYIETWLRDAGFDEIERLTYEMDGVEKVNLIARKGEGTGGLAFLSHSDTVPGEEDAWAAFDPEIRDGRLYGRGSCDMKGPLATTMIAAAGIDADKLNAPVYVVVTSDEEIALRGAEHTVEHSQILKKHAPTYGVIAEPTSLIPVYAHKGFVRIIVTAHGRSAHSSLDTGISSNFLIAPFLADMAEVKQRFMTEQQFQNDEFSPPTNGFNMILEDNGMSNVTSSRTVCMMTFRVMPDAAVEEAISLISEKAEQYGLDVMVDVNEEPVYIDPSSALIQAACAATDNNNPETVSYGTDGMHFRKIMGLVILGPGDIGVAHTTTEFVPLAELEKAVDVYRKMIESLCM
ncbi:MAG: M20/M25/M40 family metallo-hydrolase [Aggregatilineales bacterium]